MRWLMNVLTSSIGAKALMAATGLILVLFLVGHMVGNLQLFGGPDMLNGYAEFLHSKPLVLWVVRLGMIAAVLLHILYSIRLTLLNNRARPTAYKLKRPISSTFASRNMFLTGLVVAAFVTYHLLHFTFRATHPAFATLKDAHGRFDVYSMVVQSFSDPLIAGAYIVALVLLGLHLWHAIGSTFQSLGLMSPKLQPIVSAMSLALAGLLVLGNVAMPIAVLLGLVARTQGVTLP